MSDVPPLRFPEFSGEWKSCYIKDILSIGNGRDYKHLSKGNIPVFGTGGYMTSVNDYLHDGETTFIGRKGTINKPFYYNGKFWTVDTLFYTHSFIDTIPRFIYCLFQTINWLRYNEASGVPSLSKDTIEKIKVCIPNLEEQAKIATLLRLIDERIVTQNKIIEDLKLLKSAIIDYIFNNEVLSFRKRMHLSDVATKITQKNTNNHVSNVLSNSANQGIIPQSEVFDREIANEDNTSNYFVISQNDFVYNPRKSATAPYGPINRYNGRTDGVISPLYLCFRSHNIDVEYLGWYFKSDSWYKYVYQNGDTGVRHDRVSIKDEIFFSMPLFIHNADEQIEIAKRLNKIESFVKQEEQYLFLLESQKLYLLQQMFI
jgi:type I restriction enzyme S subunit